MQHKFRCVDLIGRSWRKSKKNPNNTHKPQVSGFWLTLLRSESWWRSSRWPVFHYLRHSLKVCITTVLLLIFLLEFLRSLQRLFHTWSTNTIKQQPLLLSPFHRLYLSYSRLWEAEVTVHVSLISFHGCCHGPISGWYPSPSCTGWVVPRWWVRWGSCFHHTNVSVRFQPWNCWRLWWKIDPGPEFFVEYYQFHKTLLWIWIMLWTSTSPFVNKRIQLGLGWPSTWGGILKGFSKNKEALDCGGKNYQEGVQSTV